MQFLYQMKSRLCLNRARTEQMGNDDVVSSKCLNGINGNDDVAPSEVGVIDNTHRESHIVFDFLRLPSINEHSDS